MAYFTHTVCGRGGVQDGLLLAHALFGVCAGGGAQDGLLLAHALFGEGRAHICASLPCALLVLGSRWKLQLTLGHCKTSPIN